MNNLKNMEVSYPNRRIDLGLVERFESPRRITPALSPNRLRRFLDRSSEASPVTSWEEEVLSFSREATDHLIPDLPSLDSIQRYWGQSSESTSITWGGASHSATTVEFTAQNWPVDLVYENVGEQKAVGTIELICYIFDGIVTGVTYSRAERANLSAEITFDYFPLIEEGSKASTSPGDLFLREAHDFCVQEGILEQTKVAVDLVKQNFSLYKDPVLKLDKDPETREKHVVVEFTAQGEISKILDQYNNFTEAWVSSGPWSLRRKICLEYDIKTPYEPS